MTDHKFRPEIEVLSAAEVPRRRHWCDVDKIRIVEESFLGHRQVTATARRHGVSRSLLTTWRALTVQQGLGRDPHAGEIFCFRGRKGDLVKLLWHDDVEISLYTKRLEAGRFIWPVGGSSEAVQISAAQLGYLLEGIDWRNPRWTQRFAEAG